MKGRSLSVAELTGFADGPAIEPPANVVAAIARLGDELGIDAIARVTERAEIWSYGRNGTTSCGGATRLLRAADEWIALSVTRPDDEALMPAWIGVEFGWEAIEAVVATRPADALVEHGRLLGLPVARLGERAPADLWAATRLGDAEPLARRPAVLDLSSLWAGPLCARLLADEGARVIKVESRTRPDGARRGPKEFFERMNAGKEFVAIDFTADELVPALEQADVVIEGSRPRALEQLGIEAHEIVASGPRVWLSITGHGRGEPQRDWVGFGDDAAVAGGLVAYADDGTPVFMGDAMADPLTGMAGALAVREALTRGGRWLIDCNLAGVAAYVAST